MLTTNKPILILTSKSVHRLQALQIPKGEGCLKKSLVLPDHYVIANVWSSTSNLLRKRLHKLQDLMDEMSHLTKKIKSRKVTKTFYTKKQFK